MKRIIATIRTKVATYQQELVECGKKNCSKCPHGPYWYAYVAIVTSRNNSGKTKSIIRRLYIGKDFHFLDGDQGASAKSGRKRVNYNWRSPVDYSARSIDDVRGVENT